MDTKTLISIYYNKEILKRIRANMIGTWSLALYQACTIIRGIIIDVSLNTRTISNNTLNAIFDKSNCPTLGHSLDQWPISVHMR